MTDTALDTVETETVYLSYRPPYRFNELLAFFQERALEGVELVSEKDYMRTVRLEGARGTVSGWLCVKDDPPRNQLVVTISKSLAPCEALVVSRLRRMFDVDCDPQTIAQGLAPLENTVPGALHEGVRLPGCFDPFETACRAVLGQQISVRAANKLAARITKRYGLPAETGINGLTHVFPAPATILALDSIEDAFGSLGVIKTRSYVIAEIARMLESADLDFSFEAVVDKQIEKLMSIKGVGPWTANYIAMRAFSYPDAFLESDAGVAHALPTLTSKERLAVAQEWRPWRSYAVVSLWNSLREHE